VRVRPCRDVLDDRLARHGRAALVGERDRELGQEPLEPVLLGRLLEGDRLGRRRVRFVLERIALQLEHPLDAVVVRVEVLARDGPVLVPAVVEVLVHEPALVLADEHVGVDQRAAAEPRADERVDAAEGPVVVHPDQAARRVPEALARAVGAAGERSRGIRAAALQYQHALARLGQPVRRHRPAESRTDDDRVVVAVHAHVQGKLTVRVRCQQVPSV
jgi:hypothetical protein